MRRQGNVFSRYVKKSGTKLFVNQLLFVNKIIDFMLKNKNYVYLLPKIGESTKTNFVLEDGIGEKFFK